MTTEEAKILGYMLCNGEITLCGYDQYQNPMYCYEKPAVTPKPVIPAEPCPTGCVCLTVEEAKKLDYALCEGRKILCGYDQYRNPMYCYEKPVPTPKKCPVGCECLTKDEGYKRNRDFCRDEKGNLIVCEVISAEYGEYKYCFKTAQVEECPPGCECLTKENAEKLGYELCKDEIILCGYDQYQNPLYCYKKPAVTAILAPTLTPLPLEYLSVEILPKNTSAKPGDTVNYEVILDWSPETWEGRMDVDITIIAFGFEKSYEYHSITIRGLVPPIEQSIPITIPDNAPPSVYKARVTVKAGEKTATDETSLSLEVPGFEALFALVGLLAVAYLLKKRG